MCENTREKVVAKGCVICLVTPHIFSSLWVLLLPVWSYLGPNVEKKLHRWGTNEERWVTVKREIMLCSGPSLGEQAAGSEAALETFSCVVIERSYTKGMWRRGHHCEKKIMVNYVRSSDKLNMVRQEGKVRDLLEAGRYSELWAWCRGQQGQALT